MVNVSTRFVADRKLTPRDHGFTSSRAGVELQAEVLISRHFKIIGHEHIQGIFQVLIDLHYRGLVAASVAIVGRCRHVSEW